MKIWEYEIKTNEDDIEKTSKLFTSLKKAIGHVEKEGHVINKFTSKHIGTLYWIENKSGNLLGSISRRFVY